MHTFLPKALVILTLWSGAGVAATAPQVAETAAPQPSLACLAAPGPTAVAGGCQSYMDVVTAALAAG